MTVNQAIKLQQNKGHTSAQLSGPFIVGEQEIRKRNKNLLWGLLLSVFLAVLIVIENHRDPVTYNNTLLWSILGFLVIANIVNYFRHLRYVKLIGTHRVELNNNKIIFITGDNQSELDTSDIAIMQMYRRSNRLQHIQLRLMNNRGIRLEGYDQLESMAALIAAQLQPEQVIETKTLFG